jgi:hypothetical protein
MEYRAAYVGTEIIPAKHPRHTPALSVVTRAPFFVRVGSNPDLLKSSAQTILRMLRNLNMLKETTNLGGAVGSGGAAASVNLRHQHLGRDSLPGVVLVPFPLRQ